MSSNKHNSDEVEIQNEISDLETKLKNLQVALTIVKSTN